MPDDPPVDVRGLQRWVKWFNRQKGYGFITPSSTLPEHRKDVFVHYTVRATGGYRLLKHGQRVRFDIAFEGLNPSQKGKEPRPRLRAVDVLVLRDEDDEGPEDGEDWERGTSEVA